MNPTLKATGTERLKLQYDKLLSISLQLCFQFQLAPLQLGVCSGRGAAHLVLCLVGSGDPSHRHGRAVLFDPIKPTFKPPGCMLLKLRYDGPVSNFAFNFNLRRYNMDGGGAMEKGWATTVGRCSVQADSVKHTLGSACILALKLKCDKLLSSFAFAGIKM